MEIIDRRYFATLSSGTRTTLQPVAVGVNGEIGYIAVAETTPMVIAPTTDLTMPHIHSSTLVSPAHMAMNPADHSVDLQKSGKSRSNTAKRQCGYGAGDPGSIHVFNQRKSEIFRKTPSHA